MALYLHDLLVMFLYFGFGIGVLYSGWGGMSLSALFIMLALSNWRRGRTMSM